MNMKELISDKSDEVEYFIHRTAIMPLWYNPYFKSNNVKDKNGNPLILLTDSEYKAALEQLGENAPESFKALSQFDFALDIESLEQSGITKKELDEKYKQACFESLSSFFDKGLYALEAQIDRTATKLGDERITPAEDFERKVGRENFGFSIGVYNSRAELNTAIVLAIPKKCFEAGGNFLFERAQEKFNFGTTYYVIQ